MKKKKNKRKQQLVDLLSASSGLDAEPQKRNHFFSLLPALGLQRLFLPDTQTAHNNGLLFSGSFLSCSLSRPLLFAAGRERRRRGILKPSTGVGRFSYLSVLFFSGRPTLHLIPTEQQQRQQLLWDSPSSSSSPCSSPLYGRHLLRFTCWTSLHRATVIVVYRTSCFLRILRAKSPPLSTHTHTHTHTRTRSPRVKACAPATISTSRTKEEPLRR